MCEESKVDKRVSHRRLKLWIINSFSRSKIFCHQNFTTYHHGDLGENHVVCCRSIFVVPNVKQFEQVDNMSNYLKHAAFKTESTRLQF